MSNHPHQRKLRRSFGSQPVGSIGGPRQPEAGIAVQVTQAQSSRCTFLRSDDGDLANLVAGDHRVPTRALCSGHYLGIPPPSVRTSRGSPQPHLMTTPSIPIQSNHPSISSGFTARHHLVAFKSPPSFLLKTARNQKPDRQKIN